MTTPLLASLLPTPRECVFAERGFRIDGRTCICVPSGADAADLRSATLLANEFTAATGRRLRVVRVPWYAGEHVIRLGDEGAFGIPVNWVPAEAEGYGLRIDRAGVLLAGADSAGLFYATRTLLQILRLRRASGNALPGIMIRDWPVLRYRGVMLDIARQVERADYMQTLVKKLADYKNNMFVLYFEDKFRWKKHAGLSHPQGYTPAEFRDLARVAQENHMEFVPALASLGHCEGFLRHPEMAHLREDGAIYQLSLRHPGTRKLLADLYAEILPLYNGRFFHVNCDESPLLKGPPGAGKGYLKESLRLFADHLMFLHDLLAEHGKQMMVWGDMLLHYPQIMAGLSRDIIVVDWDYGPMAKRVREAPEIFRKEGFRVMVAPAVVRSAEVCFPQYQLMTDNIPYFIRQGQAAGAMGSMTTMWELFSTNSLVAIPGLIGAAQFAWNPGALAPSKIASAVAAHLHGPAAASSAAAAYRLLSSDLFLDRQAHQARDPRMRAFRTYHLDSHEFLATDPMVYLSYRDSAWANAISRQAWRGVAAIRTAGTKARWNNGDLPIFEVSGLMEAFQADRRITVNQAGMLMVQAEKERRGGRLSRAGEAVEQAAGLLETIGRMAEELIPRAQAAWQLTKPYGDPGMEEMFLRRFRWTGAAMRQRVRTLRAAARRLAAGKDLDLNGIFGGQPALVFRAANPSADLIDLLKAHISYSADGRRWQSICNKNWFLLEKQTYITATIPPPGDGTDGLPAHIRLAISRTHIDPRNHPLAGRYEVLAARTLRPAEILDGPPAADLDTVDWRLIYTPNHAYRLTCREPWLLEYGLVAGA